MKETSRSSPRGIALVSALIVLALLMASVAGLMYYASGSRSRAINLSREGHRASCAEAGLQLARAYFGRNQSQWDTYLSFPWIYNPVTPVVAMGWAASNPIDPVPQGLLMGSNPELFVDLDGDSRPDVFMYIRDNEDERPGQTNWLRDNDQNVIVGAVCISDTMIPRPMNRTAANTLDPRGRAHLSLEALLSYNMASNGYNQANGGDGSGNYNR